jgi:F-box/leucine-rich repeat protein 2/20
MDCYLVSNLYVCAIHYPKLYSFTLFFQGCYVGDPGIAAVGQCCKQLEDLNLRFCEGLSDTGVVELALGCGKSLKSLGVAACAKITDISLEAVGLHCTSLETLSLDSEYISNKGLLAVAKGCPLLKVLKLQCINVTDEALAAVGTCCLSLEMLAVCSLQKFTDKLVTLQPFGNLLRYLLVDFIHLVVSFWNEHSYL